MLLSFKKPEKEIFVAQRDTNDCGLACLRMIMRYFGKDDIFEDIRNYPVLERGLSLFNLSRIAEKLGFKTLSAKFSFKELSTKVKFPCIAYFKKMHFVVIYGVKRDKIRIADPAVGLVLLEKRQFLENWVVSEKRKNGKGICLLIDLGWENQEGAYK